MPVPVMPPLAPALAVGKGPAAGTNKIDKKTAMIGTAIVMAEEGGAEAADATGATMVSYGVGAPPAPGNGIASTSLFAVLTFASWVFPT